MKVSVIVPAYNAERYLADTLDCLLGQTLQDIEIIVIDDGSTDGTAEVLAAYYDGQPDRIHPISQKNAGVSAARNRGLARAQGEYVLFLDSDDLLTQNTLECMVRRLDTTGADLAICRLVNFGYGGEQENPYAKALSQRNEIPTFDTQLFWNFLVGNKLYRRTALEESGAQFPPTGYSEEGAFFMQVVYSGVKIVGEPQGCMRYRRHSAAEGHSVSQRVSLSLLQDFICSLQSIFDAAKAALQQASLPEVQKQAYLQEVLYKTHFNLISLFYRRLWRADAETLQEIGTQHTRLLQAMTQETRQKAAALHDDIPELLFAHEALAATPRISVVLLRPSLQTLETVYAQSMPQFELFLPQCDAHLMQQTPFAQSENLHIMPDKGFRRTAKRTAKAPYMLTLRGDVALDERLFRLMLRVKIPNWLRRRFFQPLYWAARFVLSRRV